jgi:variant SH3 domain-containing protein
MRRVRARLAHAVPDRPPIRLAVGDEVDVGGRDTDWPEFVFVTTSDGSGWVPARYLSGLSGRAVMQRAYDTSELETEAGEVLKVVVEDSRSGWVWCRSAGGREGWVPLNTLDGVSPGGA